MLPLLALMAAAPGTATVTPFRTDVAPRVDPVFGDAARLRQSVDRFLALHGEMEAVRNEFSTAVHGTLAHLQAGGRRKGCPPGTLGQYTRALGAGGRYLGLGRQLEARFREIRQADDLGETAGLTPDYRVKIRRARELYLELLRDYREMRVAFYDQLGAELRHAGCTPGRAGPAGPDPSDPKAWELEEPEPPVAETPELRDPAGRAGKAATAAAAGSGPAVWITIDNSQCAEESQLSMDGASLGAVAGHKKVTVRTRAGPHELCVLPSSDKRACGDPGTVRRAYLYEGWTLVVRCGK